MDSSPGILNGVHTETQTEANRTKPGAEKVSQQREDQGRITLEILMLGSAMVGGGNQLRVWGIVDADPKK